MPALGFIRQPPVCHLSRCKDMLDRQPGGGGGSVWTGQHRRCPQACRDQWDDFPMLCHFSGCRRTISCGRHPTRRTLQLQSRFAPARI